MLKLPVIPIGERPFTAVEIGKNYLKIAQAKNQSNSIVITKLITEPIIGFSDDEISRALLDIVNANAIRLDQATAIIPRERTMVRYIRLPTTEPSEIENMVSFEITKQTPYSKEEIVTDFEVVSTTPDGYSEVMLVVTHLNELNRINTIFSSTGYQPQQIRVSSEAIWSWLKSGVSADKMNARDLCVIDVDAASTEVVLVSDTKMAFSRMINIGAADISLNAVEAQSYRDRLIEEIRRSIAIYLKERGQDASLVSQFIVTGSVNIIEDFKNTIAAQTGIVAEAIPVLSTLSLADGAMSEKGIAADSSVSVICGSLFMTEGINLVADELKKRQQQKAKLTKAIGLSIASALIILLTVSAVVARIYQKQKLIKQLQSMLDEINVTAGETEEKLKKIKILKQQSSEGASSLDAIYNLYKLIPSNISLVDFDYDDTQKAVRFRGRATNMSDVFKLATLLEGSDRFSNVQTRSVAKRTTQRGEVVDFQIWCNFSASAGEK